MSDERRKIRVLFPLCADADNTNAQSLNAREIALRLDPERFEITLFFQQEADRRLPGHPAIRLVQLPRRARTLRLFAEMLTWPDVIAYVDVSPALDMFLRLPKALRRGKVTVNHVEAPSGQLLGLPESFRRLHRRILSRCEVHTAITDFIAREAADNLHVNPAFILPVGVDTKLFAPPRQRSNPVPVVLFAGTVMERKGPQHVVDAANQMPDAQFWIAGPARHGFDHVLRRRCSELGVNNVRFYGSQSQAALAELMRRSDVFVLPSRLEGLPKVTLEAAASGLPCVVFRDYETPSVLDGVTGFQVNNVEEMMARLRLLVTTPELRSTMGTAAVEHAGRFDWDVIAPLWQQLYSQVAAERLLGFEKVKRAYA